MSVDIQIRDAVMSALNDDPQSGIPIATKRRMLPGEALRNPIIAVFLGEEPANNKGRDDPITRRKLEVLVELGIVTADLAEVDDLVAPLREHVVARLGDTRLGGIALAVTERGIVERHTYKLDLYNQLVICLFEVDYQTARANLNELQ